MKKRIKELQSAIQREAFVTREMERIVSTTGGESKWLFDFRRVVLVPQYIDLFAELFWERYQNRHPFQVAGLETAAIPLVAAVVMKSVEKGKPVNGFFIRKSRKKDGLLRMVEGRVTDDPIILIDDIINSGKTIMRQLAVTDALDKKVEEIFTILCFRETEYYEFASERGIAVTSLFTLPDFGHEFHKQKEAKPKHQPFEIKWYFGSNNPNFFYVAPKSAPALDTRRLYFGSDSGNFWALNQSDGSVVWKYKVGLHAKGKSIFSSPAIHGNIVYFGAYDGNVYALDSESGEKKWMFMEADWVGSSPAVAADLGLLFIGLEFGLFKKHGGIAALDLETGQKAWEHTFEGFTHCSPTYHRDRKLVAIGSNEGGAYLFNAKNGKLLWHHQLGSEVKGAPAFDEKRGYVIFGAHDGSTNVFNFTTGELIYSHKAEFAVYSQPLVTDTYLYVSSTDKHLYCIDLDALTEKWKFRASARIFSSPRLINGKLYVGANDARLYELDPESGKEISFFQVTERITNSVAYNPETNCLFLSTFANEIYCLTPKDER